MRTKYFRIPSVILIAAVSLGSVALARQPTRTAVVVSLRKVIVGHHQGGLRIAFSPDGRTLATASEDHTAKLWDAATGELKATLLGHKKAIAWIEFSSDGRRFVTASDDGTAKLWDAYSGSLQATLAGHRGAVMRAAFSPDGRGLLTLADCPSFALGGCKGTSKLWDSETGMLRADLMESCEGLPRGEFSSDGTHVVVVCRGSKARVWETASGRLEHTFEVRYPTKFWDAKFSPDGSVLATEDSSFKVLLWDMHTKELRAALQHGGIVYGVEFSGDGKWLATASADGNARIWDVGTGKELWKLGDGKSRMFQANFSPDGKKLATHDEDSEKIKLWNLRNGTLEWLIRAPKLTLERIFFTPGAKLIVAAGFTVEVSNSLTGESVATLKDSSYPVKLSPDGHTIAAAGPNHSVVLWSVD